MERSQVYSAASSVGNWVSSNLTSRAIRLQRLRSHSAGLLWSIRWKSSE